MLIGNKILLPVGKWSSNQMLIYLVYWFRPGKPNALALGWEAGSENKLEQLKINWSRRCRRMITTMTYRWSPRRLKLRSCIALLTYVARRNTTQKCSNCGTLVPKDLSIRVHVCPCCGFVCDRDVNAGCNIVDGRERWTDREIHVVEVQYRDGDERKFTPVETWTSASMIHMLT